MRKASASRAHQAPPARSSERSTREISRTNSSDAPVVRQPQRQVAKTFLLYAN